MTHKLLLVDDDPEILDFVPLLLMATGYEVMTADDPVTAIGMLARTPGRWDAAIVDLQMPEMDGKDLILNIAKSSGTYGLKGVVAFTSVSSDKLDLHALRTKIGDSLPWRYVRKGPGSFGHLKIALAELLGR
jgi:DNA-binding response OmpR family regulator